MRAALFSLRSVIAVAVTLLSAGLASPPVFHAQLLPINNFTIADGLAHNGITQIFQDANGYLWIATGEGLSRFDGYTFKNYASSDGLTSPYINDVVADRRGRLWVAINDGGIARLIDQRPEPDTEPNKKFVSYSVSELPRAMNVGRIIFDFENRLWCATEGGVFRARGLEVEDMDFDLVAPEGEPLQSREAFVDRRGRLWFGLADRVLKIENGSHTYLDLSPGRGEFVNGIVEDTRGRLFVSTNSAVYELDKAGLRFDKLNIALTEDQLITTLSPARDGSLWIGTGIGLISYLDGQQEVFSKANGLATDAIHVIYTDRENSLWLGSRGGGLSHRTNNAIVNYSSLLPGKPHRIASDSDGNVIVQIGCHPSPTRLSRISENGASPIPLPEVRTEGCNRNHFLAGSDGRWWAMSGGSLSIFDNPNFAGGGRPVLLPDGRPIQRFVTIYEDNDGNVWLSTPDRILYVAKIRSGEAPRFEIAAREVSASTILRTRSGSVWLASNVYLGRLRNGELDEIKTLGKVEKVQPRALFEDSKGRVWIGTRFNGAVYTDDPEAATPAFVNISTAEGLGSESVWSIGEDDMGGIYLGTGRGLFRFEPGSSRLRKFTSADGIPESAVHAIFKDRSGSIWIASDDGGTLRIDPKELDQSKRSPPIMIDRVSVEGVDLPLPETGTVDFTADDLSSDRNGVAIRFVGLTLRGEGSLTYRYLLEGYDRDWSPASTQREVNYANLGAGTYRFLVKAIDQRGVESEVPAVLQFKILPPIWQRWWFIALAIVALAGALYALYRYRMARVVELERVRTRIATDLHDDIGSNLTRIALMSEVLNQGEINGSAGRMLPSIANIARESVASMNDIVWAISPEHDRVLDLTRRMRQHAEEVFTIRDIDVAFLSEAADSDMKLMIGVRRDVLLIFKEAANNAARHSKCTRVEIEFSCTNSRLLLRIADNGIGFDEQLESEGHGLRSMGRRATSLGGKLEIRSSKGEGTTVRFEMPL